MTTTTFPVPARLAHTGAQLLLAACILLLTACPGSTPPEPPAQENDLSSFTLVSGCHPINHRTGILVAEWDGTPSSLANMRLEITCMVQGFANNQFVRVDSLARGQRAQTPANSQLPEHIANGPLALSVYEVSANTSTGKVAVVLQPLEPNIIYYARLQQGSGKDWETSIILEADGPVCTVE